MNKPKKNKPENKAAKTFDVIYNSLNANQQRTFKIFVKEDLKKTSRSTVRNWVNGISQPSHVEQKLIAEFLRVNQNFLFPTKK